jgi:hypothetical protein
LPLLSRLDDGPDPICVHLFGRELRIVRWGTSSVAAQARPARVEIVD